MIKFNNTDLTTQRVSLKQVYNVNFFLENNRKINIKVRIT